MNGKYRGMGYYVNDDRASGGKLTEGDVWTCSHCQTVLIRAQWEARGGWCSRCHAPLCLRCGEKTKAEGCAPFIKILEQRLNEDYRRKQLSKAIGLEEVK